MIDDDKKNIIIEIYNFIRNQKLFGKVDEERNKVINRFQPLFSKENVLSISKDEFTSFLFVKNNYHWSSLYRQKNVLLGDFEGLRMNLYKLVDESFPITERYTEIIKSVKGMGRALMTAILLVSFPNKYGVWNATSESGLKILNIYPKFKRGSSEGEKYVNINERLIELAKILNVDLWTLDYFWWLLIEEYHNKKNETLIEIINKKKYLNNIWWVNQGQTNEKEIEGGFIWAPLLSTDGKKLSHWERMKDIKKNDIIIHYSKGYISHVSIAKKDVYESKKPDILETKSWFKDGRRVDLQLYELLPPISRNKFNKKLYNLKINNGPIQRDFGVKQGYLFKFNKEGLRLLKEVQPETKWPKFINDITNNSNSVKIRNPPINFSEYLFERGFLFKTDIIENFLLSMKVKPFIIFTGNSGTGKTKLAQLFAQYISGLEMDQENELKAIKTEVKVGKSANSGGWAFKKDDFFIRYPDLKKYEKYYDIMVNDVKSRGRLALTPRLFFDSKDKKLIQMLEKIGQENPNMKVDLRIITPTEKKPHISSNYEVIPVGANWTENRHILGFFNVILKQYHTTKPLNLLMNAKMDINSPYFLVLDEMNLSHVERYFADFLSGIESNEPIPLHNSEYEKTIPSSIEIPENLIVIGTVNVDETTYMFSPKVLDRANTIEFSTIPALEYMSSENINENPKGNLEYLENPLSDINLRNSSINELKEKLTDIKTSSAGNFWNILTDEINNFQNGLRNSGFEFGFRVINEIVRFMYVSWKYEGKPIEWNNWERYYDAQIKQKILPKIHGSQRTLGDTLKNLMKMCFASEYVDAKSKSPRNISVKYIKNNAKYKYSAYKIREMDKILHSQRYVSFTK